MSSPDLPEPSLAGLNPRHPGPPVAVVADLHINRATDRRWSASDRPELRV